MRQLHEAIPIARAIALAGNPLNLDNTPLRHYIRTEEQKIAAQLPDPTDPNHQCELAANAERCVYFVALAMGLILSETV